MADKKKGPPGERAGEVVRIEQGASTPPSTEDQGLEVPKFLKRAKSVLDILPIHPAAKEFPMMSDADLLELGRDILSKGLQSPIALFCHCDPDAPEARELSNWSLLDGRNRIAAIEAVGLTVTVRSGRTSPVITVSGSAELEKWDEFVESEIILQYRGDLWAWIDIVSDPYAYVLSANVHRRHLKQEDKNRAIVALLKADPSKSDRQIGREIGADNKTVAAVRSKAEAREEIPHVDKRKDSKGRSQPAAKPKAALSPRQVELKVTREPTVVTFNRKSPSPDPDAFDSAAYARVQAAWRASPDFQTSWRGANAETRHRFVSWMLAGAADA